MDRTRLQGQKKNHFEEEDLRFRRNQQMKIIYLSNPVQWRKTRVWGSTCSSSSCWLNHGTSWWTSELMGIEQEERFQNSLSRCWAVRGRRLFATAAEAADTRLANSHSIQLSHLSHTLFLSPSSWALVGGYPAPLPSPQPPTLRRSASGRVTPTQRFIR